MNKIMISKTTFLKNLFMTLCVLSGFNVTAQTWTFTPSDDAYTYQGSASTNYGTKTYIQIKKTPTTTVERQGCLRFDMQNTTKSQIGKAVLRLFVDSINGVTNLITLDVIQPSVMVPAWNESTVVWTSSSGFPRPKSMRRIGFVLVDTVKKYFDIDVTDYVRSAIDSTNATTFIIADNKKASTAVFINAKEMGVNPPQLVITQAAATIMNNTYYVDDLNGNDNNNGTSPSTAWKSLKKVNSFVYKPGANILFKAGGVWTGQLRFMGTGSASNPIIIGKYGTGNNPIFDGAGLQYEGIVSLYNTPYVEISNIELMDSDTTQGDKRGLEVLSENYGLLNHTVIKNMNIHNIYGLVGSGLSGKGTGGIYVTTLNDLYISTRYNDLEINSCNVSYCGNVGIQTNSEAATDTLQAGYFNGWGWNYPTTSDFNNRRITNLKITNNILHHIQRNGMIVRLADGGLVTNNTVYETALGATGNSIFTRSSKGTILQYNEGYLNRATSTTGGNMDGSMYDPDFGSIGVVFQYSYSHDNSEGLAWFCNTRSSVNNTTGIPDPADTGVVFRYNISQNDLGDLVFMNYPSSSVSIYNNVFYFAGNSCKGNIIHENDSSKHTYSFYNNIIYNNNSLKAYAFGSIAANQTRTISHNTFYGAHPTPEPNDPNKLTTDPMFVNPGAGNIGRNTLNGYKLQSGSPAFGSGKLISNNGGQDFYGNLINTATPNRGVFDSTGLASIYPISSKKIISIFPNPATDKIILECSEISGPVNAYFYSIDGKLQNQVIGYTLGEPISISILLPGTYFIVLFDINNQCQIATNKILKN
jgi:hypothetical protein